MIWRGIGSIHQRLSEHAYTDPVLRKIETEIARRSGSRTVSVSSISVMVTLPGHQYRGIGSTSNAGEMKPDQGGIDMSTPHPVRPVVREFPVNLDAAVYTFSLNYFKITDTRSLHNDTDFVSVALVVGNNPPISLPTKSMGNLNNGTYQVNLSIPNIAVASTEIAAFSYGIVNTGHAKDSVEQALQTLVAAAASKGATAGAAAIGGLTGGFLGSLVTLAGSKAFAWAAEKLEGILFANCDGPVAAGDHVYSGAQLAAQTAGGKIITALDAQQGVNSPTGCGANSMYYVDWSITAHTRPPVATAG